LNERGCDIQPAIPSVIFGENHRIKHLIEGPCLAVQFRTSAGCFVVEAILK
jgi:CheY-specific phosphatase CheX